MGYILLLSGKAGSGKDTFADYLVKKHLFKKLAFAESLKEYVSEKYNIPLNVLFTQEGKKQQIVVGDKKETIRNILIKEGLEKRKIDVNYWINIVVEKIKKDPLKNIVISDFRFINEYNQIKKHFSETTTIRIIRENCENIDDISETSLESFKFDHVFFNNKTIKDFEESIELSKCVF